MKKHLTLLALTMLALISFNACNDDDNDNEGKIYFFYSDYGGEQIGDRLNTMNVTFYNSTQKAGFISVAGGEGEYSATSSDQDILENFSIEFDTNYYSNTTTLSFTLKKAGTVIITVADEKGNTGKLKIDATILSRKFVITGTALVVNNEVSEKTESEIKSDIEQNNLNENNYLILTYNGDEQGSFRVSTAPASQDVHFSGSFRTQYNEDMRILSLFLIYKDIEHHYRSPYQKETDKKAAYPAKLNFGEDLTEYYKAKYPAENITDVSYQITLGINVIYE